MDCPLDDQELRAEEREGSVERDGGGQRGGQRRRRRCRHQRLQQQVIRDESVLSLIGCPSRRRRSSRTLCPVLDFSKRRKKAAVALLVSWANRNALILRTHTRSHGAFLCLGISPQDASRRGQNLTDRSPAPPPVQGHVTSGGRRSAAP